MARHRLPVTAITHPCLPVALWLGAVLTGCAMAFMGITALAPRIVADVGLSPEAVGWYSGVVWAAALVASLASGTLVHRHNPWSISRLSLLACMAGLAGVISSQPSLFWIGALCIGIGQGLEAPPASQLLGQYAHGPRQPLFFSIKQMGVQVGAVTASLALPLITLVAGWRVALFSVVALLLILWTFMSRPADAYPAEPRTSLQSAPAPFFHALFAGLSGWWPLLRRNRTLLRLAMAASAFGATQVCMNTFLVTWSVAVRESTLHEAGLLASIAQGAGLAGRPLWGWVASQTQRTPWVLTGLGLLMTVCSGMLALSGASLPPVMLLPLVATFGLGASGWNGVFLAEVAAHAGPPGIAQATAATLVPVLLGLIIGPVAFSLMGRSLGFSTGFMLTAGLAFTGALCVPRKPRRERGRT